MNEQLPDGLQLAHDACSILTQPNASNARDAICDEHAQRLTLQHHACDQAQRIADLEAKCCTLKELHDAAADERDKAQMIADGTGADAYAHCCDNVEAWRRKRGHEMSGPEGSLCNWVDWAMGVADERDALHDELNEWRFTNGVDVMRRELDRLRERLAEIDAQEPVLEVKKRGCEVGVTYGGCVMAGYGALPVGTKLYARPVPAQAVPDVDELAQYIRSIDGRNSLGAGALAERIVEWMAAQEQKA